MLCQNCKRNDANVHMKRIVNGSAAEVHLCAECAEALGYTEAFSNFGLGLGELFGNLLGAAGAFPTVSSLRCPMCGSSFRDIAESGRLGCGECYETFYDKLLPSIERIHGKTRHVGKKIAVKQEASDDVKPQAEDIQAQLEKAVAEQNFELAAELRDKIKAQEIKKEDC